MNRFIKVFAGMSLLCQVTVIHNCVDVSAQVIEEWVEIHYNPCDGADEIRAVTTDLDGYIYVTGFSNYDPVIPGTSDREYLTIKYSSCGGYQWEARYGNHEDDLSRANDIVVDDEGNVYVTGFCTGFGTGYDFMTIKYDSRGHELWTARYDGRAHRMDEAIGIGLDSAGYIYVAGTSYVTEETDEEGIKLTLQVADDDKGRVIGKQGRIAEAMRTLLRVKAAKEGTRVRLEIS